MKKNIILILCIFSTIAASAQVQIKTKKYKIEDFPEKTLKVVRSGNDMVDSYLADQMIDVWRLSAFDFCDAEEFKRIKTDSDFYFMVLTDAMDLKNKDEAGIRSISIFKGSGDKTGSLEGMFEVASVPYCSTNGNTGREQIFLPFLLNILQEQISYYMKSDFNVSSIARTNGTLKKSTMPIYIDAADFAMEVGISLKAIYNDAGVIVTDEDTIDSNASEKAPGMLLGYVVRPSGDISKSFCYKMLIDPATSELYYIKKSAVNSKNPAGFNATDMKVILAR